MDNIISSHRTVAPASVSQSTLKRLFDFIGAILLLAMAWPLMLLIALAIKLESPGPVLFVQERVGAQGRRFRIIKFRSMYQGSERRWWTVARRDSQGRLRHKHLHDPRITRVGRILRRTKVDELPQLFNVLRREMSLVGPRPELLYIVEEYEAWQWQRFQVLPGITGWWQVSDRRNEPMHLHTSDDLYYVENRSFWLDLLILWKTIDVIIRT